MPDVAVHTSFCREVRAALSPEAQGKIRTLPYELAAFGPDIWFMYKPWRNKRQGRGRRMHTTRTGEFLTALAVRARESGDPDALFSYLAGFLCHYTLDSAAHPYIIYRTEVEFTYKGCHRMFEHSIDNCLMEREGTGGGRHPVTGGYMAKMKLPASMDADLDAVYGRVYGWKKVRKAINACYRSFRACYRLMENPKGLAARLTRLTGSEALKSLAYSESLFNGTDVENNAHREWLHSHDESIRSTESFGDLRGKAADRAVDLIGAAYRFVYLKEGTEEELAERIGSDSYLSGLPAADPRNEKVPSMRPSTEDD